MVCVRAFRPMRHRSQVLCKRKKQSLVPGLRVPANHFDESEIRSDERPIEQPYIHHHWVRRPDLREALLSLLPQTTSTILIL